MTETVNDKQQLDPRLVAAISAAVAAVIDEPYRIQAIEQVDEPGQGGPAGLSAWTFAGRLEQVRGSR